MKEVGGTNTPSTNTMLRPSQRKLFDSQVTFEEYLHYASLTREEEKH